MKTLLSSVVLLVATIGAASAQTVDHSKLLTNPVLGPALDEVASSKQNTFVVLDPSRLAHSKLMTFAVVIPSDASGIVPMIPIIGFR